MPRKPTDPKNEHLDAIEAGVVDLFSGMVRMLGLPPSIGAIYGLLFISREPLCLDDFVAKLGISKGSASQGLAVLKKLGALRPVELPARREYFAAEAALKKLVGGFLRSEVVPNLDHGGEATARLLGTAAGIDDLARREFLVERLERLVSWQRRGRQVLGLLHRFLD
jgi:DNA-binding transcriptional regulator GbsR (MarR family)